MTQDQKNDMQLNLNTVLLAICMGLSGWVLYSINQLDEKMAGLIPQINQNANDIIEVNKVDGEQSIKIEDMSTRLTKLETLQDIQKK